MTINMAYTVSEQGQSGFSSGRSDHVLRPCLTRGLSPAEIPVRLVNGASGSIIWGKGAVTVTDTGRAKQAAIRHHADHEPPNSFPSPLTS